MGILTLNATQLLPDILLFLQQKQIHYLRHAPQFEEADFGWKRYMVYVRKFGINS